MAGTHPTSADLISGKVLYQRYIDQISENLREQISKSIKDMKIFGIVASSESPQAQPLLPLFSVSPQGVDAPQLEDETPKIRSPAKVIAQFDVSYHVPPVCLRHDIDVDRMVLLFDESGSNMHHQYSFFGRLQNWTLQQRERSNGKMRDVYYYYNISGRMFRSITEVVKFIIYEKYPNQKDKKPEVEGEGTAAANE